MAPPPTRFSQDEPESLWCEADRQRLTRIEETVEEVRKMMGRFILVEERQGNAQNTLAHVGTQISDLDKRIRELEISSGSGSTNFDWLKGLVMAGVGAVLSWIAGHPGSAK